MGIDPSGYGVIDDYNYQTKQKSNVMQSFREAEKKSVKTSNFYMDYYTSDNRGATPFPTSEELKGQWYKDYYTKGNNVATPRVNKNGEVVVENPYYRDGEGYGPKWVTEDVYNCLKDVEEGKDIELDNLSDDAVSELLEVVDSASEYYDEQRNLFENGSKEDKELEKLYSAFDNLYYDVNKENKLRGEEEKQRQIEARIEEKDKEYSDLLIDADKYFIEHYDNYLPGSIEFIDDIDLPYAMPVSTELSKREAMYLNIGQDIVETSLYYLVLSRTTPLLGVAKHSKLAVKVVEFVVANYTQDVVGGLMDSPDIYIEGTTTKIRVDAQFDTNSIMMPADRMYDVEFREDGSIIAYATYITGNGT